MWFSIIGYDPVVRYRAFIRSAYDIGLCCDELRFITGRSKSRKSYDNLSILKIENNKYITNIVESFAINYYAIPAHEISREVSDYSLYIQFKKYLEGNSIRTYCYEEISKMQNDFIVEHDVCSSNL